jgi:methionine-rich copper-binding protein CopC
MSQNTNSTKNLIISIALLTLIISSGAFTVYQIIRKQPSEQGSVSSVSSTRERIMQSLTSSSLVVFNSETSNNQTLKKEEPNKSPDFKITFDPYISGQSITGMIDNSDKIQSMVIKLTETLQPNNVLEFKPTIDYQKNFKILLDSKTKNGKYKVEYVVTGLDQKETKGDSVIDVKIDAGTSSSETPAEIPTTIVQAPTSAMEKSNEKQSEISQEKDIQSQTKAATSLPSTDTVNNTSTANNPLTNTDAIRTGGDNITILLVIVLIVLLGYARLVASSNRSPNLNIIFGKIK